MLHYPCQARMVVHGVCTLYDVTSNSLLNIGAAPNWS